ncbi:hypothetical protein R69746_08793 [Paraburkholderia aspalathi]|nr:hypothetical protein R69746_08793 [Paraburkholderia aspalathi]CAE6876279.1 hypothetical protein R75465_08631 [Paraburkholderia aspalathi]
MLEQHTRAIGAGPAQGTQPASKAELDAALNERAVAVTFANLRGVLPALPGGTVGNDAIVRVVYVELRRECLQNCVGYRRWVFQKRAEEAYRRQLQRIAQATAVAPLGSDPLAVIVIEVEVPRQFVGGKRLWIAAVAFPLCGGQEADRHGVNPLRCRGLRE